MPQISKGDTFANGQQVTGTRLNNLVDSSTLLVGAITEQPSITANTLQSTDSTIVNDGGVLKEATIGDILNSNIPITTQSINNVGEVVLTSSDSPTVTGASFTSTWTGGATGSGTITVTSTSHGLLVNQFVNLSTAADGGLLSGSYRITAVTTNSFTVTSASKVVPLGTGVVWTPTTNLLNYNREGSLKVDADLCLPRAAQFNSDTQFNSSVTLNTASTLNIKGTATAVTPSANDNSTKIATTAYVDSQVSTASRVNKFVRFDGTAKTGTWSQSGTTVTVSITNHGAVAGQPVHLVFTSGVLIEGNGSYLVATVGSSAVYTFTVGISNVASGNVTQNVNVISSLGLRVSLVSPSSSGVLYDSVQQWYTLNYDNGTAPTTVVASPNSVVSSIASQSTAITFYTPAGVITRPATCSVICCR